MERLRFCILKLKQIPSSVYWKHHTTERTLKSVLRVHGGKRWCSFLTHCATSGFDSRWGIRIFDWLNPSGHTMALGSSQEWVPATFRGKGDRWVGQRTFVPSCADCIEILGTQPPGALRACPSLYRDCSLRG